MDILQAKITFEYLGSNPEEIAKENVGTSEDPEYVYTPADGNQRLWLKNANVARTGKALRNGGDYIKANQEYGLLELGFDQNTRIKTFYIEGIRRTQTGGGAIQVVLDYPSWVILESCCY